MASPRFAHGRECLRVGFRFAQTDGSDPAHGADDGGQLPNAADPGFDVGGVQPLPTARISADFAHRRAFALLRSR
jgi:hypothetical protein